MSDEDPILTELHEANREARTALVAWRDAKLRQSRARQAAGEAGVLACEYSHCANPGAIATRRYRCGRWYCSSMCHDWDCGGGPGPDPGPAL